MYWAARAPVFTVIKLSTVHEASSDISQRVSCPSASLWYNCTELGSDQRLLSEGPGKKMAAEWPLLHLAP